MTTEAEAEQRSLEALKDPDRKIINWLPFANDKSSHVRHATVSHQKCPNEALRTMLNDPDPRIQDIARQRLQIKGMLEKTPAAR